MNHSPQVEALARAILVQIVPALPPAINGVGDYGLILAREFRRRHGIETLFLCAHRDWSGPAELEGFAVRAVGPRPERDFARLLASTVPAGAPVLLHYVGPGYDHNACPFWILQGLQEWKRQLPGALLLTMFHELYSEGPPWTRSFWTNPFQRRLCRELALLSDVVRTNVREGVQRLEHLAPAHTRRVACTPVFSNVGELAAVECLPWSDRSPWLAIFGSAGWRQRAYEDHAAALRKVCVALRIERIWDIGRPMTSPPMAPVPVQTTGLLTASEISRLLGKCRAGFVPYPGLWLGKSSILAAYAAHGLIPITHEQKSGEHAEIRPGEHYIPVDRLGEITGDPAQFSAKVYAWYSGHTAGRQADEIWRHLSPKSPRESPSASPALYRA